MTFARTLVLALTLPLTLAGPANIGTDLEPVVTFERDGSEDALVTTRDAVDTTPKPPPAIEVIQASPENEAAVNDALAHFAAAGLILPDVQIVFHEDDLACSGHLGLFEPSQQPWKISICTNLAFVPVHELAHAWIQANVDQPMRERYMDLRDIDAWNSKDIEWGERGVEDAAFVIQQNLTAGVRSMTPEWKSRLEAFALLTGTNSPVRSRIDLDSN